jgi:hypothetical protein
LPITNAETEVDESKWYAADDAAGLLHVTVDTVKKYCRDNELAAKQVGPKKRWFVKGSDIRRKRQEWGLTEIAFASAAPRDVTSAAREHLRAVSDERSVLAAQRVLDALKEQSLALGARELSPVALSQGEDGVILIEWMFPHFRLGFSIEPTEAESGWYFVSDETAGSVNACGALGERGTSTALSLLVTHLESVG